MAVNLSSSDHHLTQYERIRRRLSLPNFQQDPIGDSIHPSDLISSQNQHRFGRHYRRVSVAMSRISERDSIQNSLRAIRNMISAIYQFIKKWVMVIIQHAWDIICLNYATMSERADLEGRSAMDSFLIKILKNVRYQNYQIRLADDLYGNIIRMPWSYIFGLIAMMYLFISVLFTFTYVAVDSLDLHLGYSFWHWFVFSLSTTTCLGLSNLDADQVHIGILLIANFQAFISQLLLAFITGIVFARFSRRRSQIRFAEKLIINQMDGIDCIQGRLTPHRPRFGIFDCNIRLYLNQPYVTKEGECGLRTIEVPLLINNVPTMAIMMKFTHRLDESSAIRKMMIDPNSDFSLMTTLSGVDACTLNPIFDVKRYHRTDIKRDHRFVDMLERIYTSETESEVHIDLNKLDQIIPDQNGIEKAKDKQTKA
ncbi:uncharacterized protein TRIADDRAFT_53815 [Trichoplax adhaerens]|uniref:Inward rectifier potassium channel C-terminal domain-containing protein n=1 Tax=Trichoplax adhaerens TaxID=10228 RepID=B3RQ87_TRIAD|nr:hypothetical protein TRIADDRAFT_53815 [Trichoplax adhaerens]EDV27780.1 hypothetical protein TRIADDRAFT_53815 [Trichoplax adhaerens]|eukprot:XP_002109614.1 hypothetical protein TRIADDRAFT_53815 [Trichoplax adhaerens]